MTITVTSTTKIVELNGVPCRIWEGHTNSGIEVHVFIVRIAVHRDEDASQFERELKECEAPSAPIAAYPLRMIL